MPFDIGVILMTENLWNRVQEILFNDWDPIGVSVLAEKDIDLVRDEYDTYIKHSLEILLTSDSPRELYYYLQKIEVDHIEVSVSDEVRTVVAEKIWSLRPDVKKI